MTGFKSVLVERVIVCVAILFFEDELDAKIFQQFHSNSVVVPSFDSLPEGFSRRYILTTFNGLINRLKSIMN